MEAAQSLSRGRVRQGARPTAKVRAYVTACARACVRAGGSREPAAHSEAASYREKETSPASPSLPPSRPPVHSRSRPPAGLTDGPRQRRPLTFQNEQAQSTTEVVVLQTRVLPREQRDTGDSGDYEQDGVRRANPGAELAGSYSPVALKLPVAEHTEGARMVTTNKMAFSPDPTSFAGTLTPSCPQLSACVVPDGSRSPSAAIPLPFLIVRNNGKVRRNEDYKQDGGREAYT